MAAPTVYGDDYSVYVRAVRPALEEKGVEIERTAIKLDKPLKRSGKSEVEIKLHADVTATLTVTVETEEKAAPKTKEDAPPASEA